MVDAPAGICGVATRLVAPLGAAGGPGDDDVTDDDVTAAALLALDVDPADGLVDNEAPDRVEFCEAVAPERPGVVVVEPEFPDGTAIPGSVPLVAIPPAGVRIWALAGAPSATEMTIAIANARAMSGP